MWPFSKDSQDNVTFAESQKNSIISDLQQERDGLVTLLKDITGKYENSIAETRKLFVEFSVKAESRDRIIDRIVATQGDVIAADAKNGLEGDAVTATPYSLRVNTTLKRLEYINKSSAVDGDGNEWPDADWLPVLRGDFVEYTP